MLRNTAVALLAGLALCTCGNAENEQAQREQAFQERMQNVVLEGSFTIVGREGAAREERYEIEKVSKLPGGFWAFHARIQYGDHDVTAPVPVSLVWAGDTPMVSLTNVGIPGLGEGFTARVVFYRDRYAGLWWHGETGGHMFGTILPQNEDGSPSEP